MDTPINPASDTFSTVDPSARLARVAAQRALLHDPIRFAQEMTERIFYSCFDDLFTYDRAPVRHFDDLLKAVLVAGPEALPTTLRALDAASFDVIGDCLGDVGIPMGIAIERIRQVMLDCLARMNNARVPYPNLDRYTAS